MPGQEQEQTTDYNSLTLDFLPSRTVKNEFLLFKPSRYSMLLWKAKQTLQRHLLNFGM